MFYRITPICLDALRWRTSDATCRDHLAVKPVGQQLPCQRIAARARLVDYLQGARGAVMTQSFADLLKSGRTVPTKCGTSRSFPAAAIAMESLWTSKPTYTVITSCMVCLLFADNAPSDASACG